MELLESYTACTLPQLRIVLHPSLRIAFSPERGFHVTTTSPLPADTLLLTVPLACCLTASPRDPRVRHLLALALPPLYVSACLLLCEDALGLAASRLGAHLLLLRAY